MVAWMGAASLAGARQQDRRALSRFNSAKGYRWQWSRSRDAYASTPPYPVVPPQVTIEEDSSDRRRLDGFRQLVWCPSIA